MNLRKEEQKVAKLLNQRRMGWLNDFDCMKEIRSLKLSMKFKLEDHQELGNRMKRTLRQYKYTVSKSHKTTIHLELVRAMLIEKLQEKVNMTRKTPSSKAGSEIRNKFTCGNSSSSSKPTREKDSVTVTQPIEPVATPSTSSPVNSATNPEYPVMSTVSNSTQIPDCEQPEVQVITADKLSGKPEKMLPSATIVLHNRTNQLLNTATSSATSPTSQTGTGVHSGAQNTSRKGHFDSGIPLSSNIATKVCLAKTEEERKMENKADTKTNANADVKTSPPPLPVVEQKFTLVAKPSLINVTMLQEEKGKKQITAGVAVKDKINENLIAVQTVNEQSYVYDWKRKKNVLAERKERGHILEGDAKDLSKSEGMVNRPKPKPYPNPRTGITLRLNRNVHPAEPEVIVIEDLSDEEDIGHGN